MLDNGHLQIRSIKKTDEGVYNCEARVAARGEIDYKKITVVVNGESGTARLGSFGPSSPALTRHLPCLSVFPSVQVRQSEVNATADVGSSAVLVCDADGFPYPVVTWAQYVSPSCRRFALQDSNSQREFPNKWRRRGVSASPPDPGRVFSPTGRRRYKWGSPLPSAKASSAWRDRKPGLDH